MNENPNKIAFREYLDSNGEKPRPPLTFCESGGIQTGKAMDACLDLFSCIPIIGPGIINWFQFTPLGIEERRMLKAKIMREREALARKQVEAEIDAEEAALAQNAHPQPVRV